MLALELDDGLGLSLSATSDDDLRRRLAGHEDVLIDAAGLAYSARGAVAMETENEFRERLPELCSLLHGVSRSMYTTALMTRQGTGPCVGSLVLFFPDERRLADEERTLIDAHADQAAEALARARVTEREHEAAVQLERSLLAEQLPQADGVAFAGRYRAGSTALEVGGDWYDAVRRPDGIIHLSVGDVAGRGLAAAALMGQLRTAFRAYAFDLTSPAEILRRLIRHVSGDEMATAVCITVDPYTRELVYASAGHVPPLMAAGGESVSILDHEGAPPLGFASARAFHDERVRVPRDATILAYTDGLIERRDRSLDDGLKLLVAATASASGLDAGATADSILRDVVGTLATGDDVALLVVRIAEVPARMAIEIPAAPAELSRLRRRVLQWLELRGLGGEERSDAVLALSEACNNAIEHGYANNTDGTIVIALEHASGVLQIVVEDEGAWDVSAPASDRGRGIPIMRRLMDSTEFEVDESSTRVTLERRLER
jgi:serine phosphatase RsbU (regulator of sigma subunit)/anti-sigma regulatory factor (Ser/Thr protein kinase)